MSKEPKNQGEQLTQELHEMQTKPLKDKLNELWTFIKKLVATSFALAIGGLGVIAITYTRYHTHGLNRVALIVSGSCAVVDGLYLLYTVHLKVGK